MRFIGNIIWLVFGGILGAIAWLIAGLLLCVTIIGIPFGLQCFKIAGFVLWPFGREVEIGNFGALLDCSISSSPCLVWFPLEHEYP